MSTFDISLDQVSSILKALPTEPVGIFSMAVAGIFFTGFIFFRNGPPVLQFLVFSMLLLATGAAGFAAYSLQEIRTISSRSPTNRLPPDAAFGFLPPDTNILVFDASNSKSSGKRLAEAIVNESLLSEVDYLAVWKNEWKMAITRIYYLGEENRKVAEELEEALRGLQLVIDYKNQEAYQDKVWWPDKPSGKASKMVGFNFDRDLVVFAGNDLY